MVPQKQTFASTYSKVALSKVEAAVASTSVSRTSPVVAESAKSPVYSGENGVASINSSSVSTKPKESTSTGTPVPTKKSTSLSTKALSPSAVNPQLYVDDVSSTLSLEPEILTPVTAASTTRSISVSTETLAFEPSKPLPRSATTIWYHTVISTVSSHWISSSPHISESPTSSPLHISQSPTSSPPTPSRQPVDYKLILCVAVPLFAVLVFVIVVAMVLCIRRYRK